MSGRGRGRGGAPAGGGGGGGDRDGAASASGESPAPAPASGRAGGGGGRGGGKGGKRGGRGGAHAADDAKVNDAFRRREADVAAAAAQAAAAAAAKQAEAERAKQEAAAAAQAAAAAAAAAQAEAAAASAAAAKRASAAAARARFDDEQVLWKLRLSLRDPNLAASKAAQANGGSTGWQASAKMDSSIKKCSGYLKKLKLMHEHAADALLRELEGVSLAKYVSEVVALLVEFRFARSADVLKACQIASVMHQRHGPEEFTQPLVAGLLKVFEGHKTAWKRATQERQNAQAAIAASGGAANAANAAAIAAVTMTPAELEEQEATNLRKRSTLRLMTELYLCGLTSDLKPLLAVLSDLIASDTRSEPDRSNTVLHLLTSWLKYAAPPLLGLQSRRERALQQAAELPPGTPIPDFLTTQQRDQVLSKLFIPYRQQMHERLVGIHTSLQKLEHRCARISMMRGEIPLDMQEERRSLREQMQALQSQLEVYVDLLDSELEPLPVIQDAEDELFNLVSLNSEDADALALGETELGPWDDAETKHFYENLLDLTIVVPPVMLQEGNEKEKSRIRREKEKGAAAAAAAAAEEEADEEEEKSAPTARKAASVPDDEDDKYVPNWEMTIEQLEAKLASMQQAGGGGARRAAASSSAAAAAAGDRDVDSFYDEDEHGNAILPDSFSNLKEKRSHPMEALLASMAHSLNRESVDAIAEKFCYLNTKNNRMRLVEAMYTLPRTRTEEIPYWCRLLATLHAHMKGDMVEELVGLLTSEFYRLLRNKSQFRVESRIRNLRYLSELTKFKLTKPTLIFRVWHALLLQFNPTAIQLIALLLESCGRWLYRTPQHHMRCVQFLERTMQLKESKFLDKTLNLMLENAYFAVKPPPVAASLQRQRKERTPVHQFIRKTIFEDLNTRNVDAIIKRLRKLNWNDVQPASAQAAAAQAAARPAAASAATPAPAPATSPASSDATSNTLATADSSAAAPASAVSPAPAPPVHVPARILVIRCLSNVCNVSYAAVPALAHLCSGLHKVHQVGPVVVDNVLEEVRVGLEMNRYSQNQRRLQVIRYLAELYAYKLLDSQTLFDTMYLFITLGHELDEQGKLTSKLDPPSDTFRVRLLVTLLDSVGGYLVSPLLRARLDRFLLYFQRYLFLKEVLPIDLQFAVSDVLEKLRPNLVRAASLEECMQRIGALEAASSHATHDRLVSLSEEAMPSEGSDAEMEGAGGIEEEEDKDDEEDVDDDEGGKRETADAESNADKAAANNALMEAALAAADAEEGDDDLGSDALSDDDDDAWERSAPRGAAPRRAKEEEEFQAELDRMMADAIEGAKMQPRTHQMATVEAVTTAAGVDAPRHSPTAAASHLAQGLATGSTVDGEEAVAFRFLSRHNKRSATHARALWVPADSDMASSCVANAAVAAQEKADLKRLVLRGLARTEREQEAEDRLNQREVAFKDRREGVTQDFSHRNVNPAERMGGAGGGGGGGGGGGASGKGSLANVAANFGKGQEKAREGDLSLRLEQFAFADESTLTQSRVTLQGDSRRKK